MHQPANVFNVNNQDDEQEQVEDVQAEQLDDDWDELEQEAITDRVALFLAHLRSRSSQTFTNINYVVEHTSSLIGDIVNRLKTKTMSLFSQLGHDQNPQVQELQQEFSDAAKPFKGLETDYKQIKYFTNSGNFIQPVEEVSHMFSRGIQSLAVSDKLLWLIPISVFHSSLFYSRYWNFLAFYRQ